MIHALFAQDGGGGLLASPLAPLFMIGLLILFWVVVVLPASRRQKREQEQMLAALKPGTKIVTNAGIIGKVVSAKDGEDEIVIRSEDTRLKILRSAVIKVLGTDESEANKS
jgi:preprotein translocase subunit YajC